MTKLTNYLESNAQMHLRAHIIVKILRSCYLAPNNLLPYAEPAPRDRTVAAPAGSLSDPVGAKTEHGSGKDTATTKERWL
jgi:hypothetical protein